MRRVLVLRYALGWLAAAATAVGLAFTVIELAVGPGGRDDPGTFGADLPAATGSPAPVPSVVAGPLAGATSTSVLPSPSGSSARSGASSRSPSPAGSGSAAPSSGRRGSDAGSPSVPGSPSIPGSPSRSGSAAAPSSADAAGAPGGGTVRSVQVHGGQLVLRLFDDRAELVTATPSAGFGVRNWEAEGWLRVTFSAVDGGAGSSVFVTWNGHPPEIQTVRDGA